MGSADARGLSSAQARDALTREGPNDIDGPARTRGLLRFAAGLAAEPMFLLLLAGAGVYLLIGDAAEGAMLGGFGHSPRASRTIRKASSAAIAMRSTRTSHGGAMTNRTVCVAVTGPLHSSR